MHPREDDVNSFPPMPLAMATVGQTVTFVGVTNSGRGLTHRLAEMGLTRGQAMEVINRTQGPFIVEVKGTRLLLGRGMVQRILVRPA